MQERNPWLLDANVRGSKTAKVDGPGELSKRCGQTLTAQSIVEAEARKAVVRKAV
jgi:hypothetical protein